MLLEAEAELILQIMDTEVILVDTAAAVMVHTMDHQIMLQAEDKE